MPGILSASGGQRGGAFIDWRSAIKCLFPAVSSLDPGLGSAWDSLCHSGPSLVPSLMSKLWSGRDNVKDEDWQPSAIEDGV